MDQPPLRSSRTPLPKGQLVWVRIGKTDHAAHVEAPPSSDPTRCAVRWTSSGVIEDVCVDHVATSLAPRKRKRAEEGSGVEDVCVDDDVATSLAPRKRKRAEEGGGGDRPIAAKGERVMKFFQCTHDGPGRYYEGTLEALPSKAWPYYHIVYDDGDQEELASDEFWAIYSYWRVVKKALRPSEFVPDDRVLANDGRTGKVRTFRPSGAESVWSYLIHYDHTNANKAEWVDEVDLRLETKWNVARMKKEQAKLAGRAKSQDEKAPPGRKMNEAGKREEAVAHSTEARKREEAKKAPPVAKICTVKGCSKARQSGCNGMCKAHSREAGNPVPRPDAQT